MVQTTLLIPTSKYSELSFGIEVTTIPTNISPTTVNNPKNVSLPYIGKELLTRG